MPPPPYSRVNPLLQGLRKPQAYQVVVGAGSPAKGPGLRANLHPPLTVVAATVFAGKPAPTRVT
ncbi:hypothetical protein PRJ_1476 [Pseudomonas sp. XWY-1]|nr:hypothetical protein PRJ_1476 [Pseudomonas sp. XWY-1]